MILIIIGILIAALVIAILKMKRRKETLEYDELKETIHNSGIIKEIREQLQVLMYTDYDWSHEQIDYYDSCDRSISVFDSVIGISVWKDDRWQPMFSLDFVKTLGYRPLLDNDLQAGKKYITRKDVFMVFTSEVANIVKDLFHNDEIKFDVLPTYFSGFRSEKQSDGSYEYTKVGDEHATVEYKVPKSIDAKKI